MNMRAPGLVSCLSALLLAALSGGAATAADCAASRQGAQTMRQIEEQWPLRPPRDQVSDYVWELGQRLARVADPRGQGRWHFHVLRNLEPSALALGDDGFVISDGLIAFVRNESELAAVLLHEIAHQFRGHFCRRASRSTQRFNLGNVAQHFELDIEIEADAQAVAWLERAGFDPDAMRAVLRRLADRAYTSGAGLTDRIVALTPSDRRSHARRIADSPEFARTRAAILDEFGAFDR